MLLTDESRIKKKEEAKESSYFVDLLDMSLTVKSMRRIRPRFWIFPEIISGVSVGVNIALTLVFPSFALNLSTKIKTYKRPIRSNA